MAGFRSGYIGDKGAERLGNKYSFAYGSWQVDANPGNFKSLYNSFQHEMIQVHLQQQTQFQDLVVANIKRSIKRKGASTGRLAEVTADPRNRLLKGVLSGGQGATYGWGVGNTKFLDVSVAKYWRTIEEGSAAVWSHPFVTGIEGLRTKGGDPLWGWFGAGATRGGSGALATGPYSAPGKGAGGKFRPWYMENKSGNRTYPWKTGESHDYVRGLQITHEIAPMDAYLKAWRTVEKDVFKGWEQAWQATFGRGLPNKKELLLNTPNGGARGPRKGR